MNQLFLGVLVTLVSAVSFSKSVTKPVANVWPQEVVAKLQSKDFYKAFCDTSFGGQTSRACADFAILKNTKQKWPTASIKENVITLNDGKRSMQLKRTKSPTQFEINNQIVDIAEHRDGKSLYEAIVAVTPKVAAGSFWMNSAYAQESWYKGEETTYQLMSIAAHQLVNATSDTEVCKAAEDFTKQCAINIDTHPEITLFTHFITKHSEGRPLTEDDKRMFLNSTENLQYELIRMRNLTKGFDKKVNALIACPSKEKSKDRSAAQDVIDCAKALEDGIRDLKTLADVMGDSAAVVEEKVAGIKEELRTYTEKPSSKAAPAGKSTSSGKKAEGTR